MYFKEYHVNVRKKGRVSKANRCVRRINHLLKAKQLSVFKTILRPTVLYGCESCGITKIHKRQ